ncbi:EamA family transporter [Fusibacter bizertensis]
MWVIYAFGSAIFAGLTAILSKQGIRNLDSNVATALRTIIVLIFSWLMVFIMGSQKGISDISTRTLLFLVLSGLATGGSWLCYFKALQLGDVNKVTPIDKSSTILTMILAFIFLGETITIVKFIAMVLIGIGTYWMIEKKENKSTDKNKLSQSKTNLWLIYAFGAAIFASLTSILGKVGIEGIDSSLGTAIRTVVVLFMSWLVVFVTKKQGAVKNIDKKSAVFLTLSGFATGGSWLLYYRALQEGPASVVVPIDKLSILVTISFSFIFLKEKLSQKAILGLALIVTGTMLLLL